MLLHGKSPIEIFSEFKSRYGDIFQFWFGPTRYIIVGNVNDIQHIFTNRHIYDQGNMFIEQFSTLFPNGYITLTGSKHKRHAAIAMPLFRRAKIINNFDLIVDCTDKLLSNWSAMPSHHVHCDIVRQCQNLLLEIFGLISFDYNLDTLNEYDSNKNELTRALHVFMSSCALVFYSPPIVGTLYTNLNYRHRQAKAIIERHIYQLMDNEMAQTREARAERKRTCLIASLVASLQEDEEAEAKKSEDEKTGLSRVELLHEILAFMVAGFETTSTVLAWFIHAMSNYPDVQHKMKEELMSVSVNQNLTLNQLDSLVYLDCVINEILRFYPITSGTVRTLTVDDRLPKSSFQLNKGDSVLIPFYNLAHDTQHWSIDTESFAPERFLNEDKNHHPYALLPFGGGHRQCIGQALARFELKVIIARMLQRVTFGDGGPKINSGGYFTGLTIQPKHVGVTIGFS
ncbi:unnamed protein product [Rotaria magnacalcarata]|uniref:Cytochrome P450 n=2 Tax=Rotaria magnacalcarata TaxID=392030 RepID=A0A814T5Q1_9BILA|nr:unnamed protein product [Rotaria magnacalcarata]